VLSLAKAAKDYYLQKLGEVSPREDYYLRGGTATGRWRGSGAVELGLDGAVSVEGLVRLFDGEHPGTGEQLGRRLRRDGVAAWDVTFSADKSVSLLWALGDEATRCQVLEAFDEATAAALGYLESVASSTRGAAKTKLLDDNGDPVLADGTARFRVETWPIATSGYVAASFTEFTSRADDPQIHTHVVVANKVRGVDGVWRVIDGRLLFRHQLAAGYLHEAVLRRELTERLGVRWQPVRNGMADIEGFTGHQIEAFSRRRRQLEAWREEHGLPDTAAAREVAVLVTRNPKRDHPLDQLVGEWRQRALEVGLTPERIVGMTGRSRNVTLADPAALFQTLASAEGLTAQASTFGRAEVVKEVAAALPEGGTRSEIDALCDEFLRTREVVPLLSPGDTQHVEVAEDLDEGEPERLNYAGDQPMRRRDGTIFPGTTLRLYTTAELLATEERIVQRALDGIGAGQWKAPERLVKATLRRRRRLTEGQREMVRRLATSGNAVDVGVGPAGTGKTAVMDLIGELAMVTGAPILGAALAARAVAGLEAASGIPSTTLTRLIAQTRHGGGLPSGVVVVVDEAGMVGTRLLAAVSDLVDAAQGKLILIGDDRQLPEIDAGGMFRTLIRRLPAVELNENVRQTAGWERVALTQLRAGSVDQAVDAYLRRGRLIVGTNREETIAQAVRDWHRYVQSAGDLTEALLIAYGNDTVAELNQRARAFHLASKRLHGPVLQAGEQAFQAGDRILCLKNHTRLGVLNGDLATIVAVQPHDSSVMIRLDRHGATRDLPGWYLSQGNVDYGYAMTGHKAQGVTTSRTFTVITGPTDREWAYVALSRGHQANTLYLAATGADDRDCTHLTRQAPRHLADQLASALNRSSAQIAALDCIPRPGIGPAPGPLEPPPPSSDVAARVSWLVAQRIAKRQPQPPEIGLTAHR
jgi:conjugative relaxase-like TrwC/TraI family protein